MDYSQFTNFFSPKTQKKYHNSKIRPGIRGDVELLIEEGMRGRVAQVSGMKLTLFSASTSLVIHCVVLWCDHKRKL